MPTVAVNALLMDAPSHELHELYERGAAAIMTAYLSSGFPVLAIDPDRDSGFSLPTDSTRDHRPSPVDRIKITLEDLSDIPAMRGRQELSVFRQFGAVYFHGDASSQTAITATKSCGNLLEFGLPQAIVPPVARAIMDYIYPKHVHHVEGEISDRHMSDVMGAWMSLRAEAGMADSLFDPLFDPVVEAWRTQRPVVLAMIEGRCRKVDSDLIWDQYELNP